MKVTKLYNLIFVLALSSCAATGTSTTSSIDSPQKIVFAAKTSYAVAQATYLEYKALPDCKIATTVLCSNSVIIEQGKKADNVAYLALNAAEDAVRTPQIGSTAIDKAISAGQVALDAFLAITSQLRTK